MEPLSVQKPITLIAAALLGACTASSSTTTDIPKASNLELVKIGMTQEQAGAVLGDFQREDYDPSNGYSSCRSYAYGTSPNRRYVHVWFHEKLVERADDGNIGLCIYGGDIRG